MRSSARSPEAEAWRHLYHTPQWRALRKSILIRDMFQCQQCKRIETQSRNLVANHKIPHKGNEALFWDQTNIQCVCKRCHDGHIQSLERGGRGKPSIGIDGWPIGT